MANCLYLHDNHTTKFDFMNYAFAKLVVAWLYSQIPDCYKRIANIAINFEHAILSHIGRI